MIRVKRIVPGFCMGRAVAHVRSPSHHYKKTYSGMLIRAAEKVEFSSKNSGQLSFSGKESKTEFAEPSNRVMVVVDSSAEAKGALQWALSHTVQSQDTVILLHITKPSKQGVKTSTELDERTYEVLCSMKNMCQTKRTGVNVEIVVEEGKEKGPRIVEAVKQHKVSLLVLGQRKRSMIWRLQSIWNGARKTGRTRVVDYCIQNANCMTIAVRRKSRKYGGYLITTKRHKKFWLLA